LWDCYNSNFFCISFVVVVTIMSGSGSTPQRPSFWDNDFFDKTRCIMRKFLISLQRDERGVTALEYAILAGVVVVAVIAAGATLSSTLTTTFSTLSTKISAAI